MILVTTNTKIWQAPFVTERGQGYASLVAYEDKVLKLDLFMGDLYVFPGWRGDLSKDIWWDGQWASLFSKHLNQGEFV